MIRKLFYSKLFFKYCKVRKFLKYEMFDFFIFVFFSCLGFIYVFSIRKNSKLWKCIYY